MGRNRVAAASMTSKVFALLEASQTVRLWLGLVDDGIMKGNSARPAVSIVAACTSTLAKNAAPARPRRSSKFALAAAMTAASGAAHIHGHSRKLPSQAPATTWTDFCVGFDGPP